MQYEPISWIVRDPLRGFERQIFDAETILRYIYRCIKFGARVYGDLRGASIYSGGPTAAGLDFSELRFIIPVYPA